jgi:hypothetical protein
MNRNTYAYFYGGREGEVEADTLWEAVQRAREYLRVPRSRQGLLSVLLVKRGDAEVVHSTTEL